MQPSFLKGIRVTDLTWAGAGTFGTKVLSDFGAEVLKIESMTRPDPVRVGGPFKDGIPGTNRSGYFASRNTGKKSVAVNLKTAAGRRLVLDLVARSDVVANNFGPGAMERLGLGEAALRAAKPDIISLAMPMYGEDGPRAQLLGVGMTISAVAGMMWHTAYAPGDPVGPGTHFPDHAANPYHAAFAVIAALRHRRRTGEGMTIDLSQVESTVNFMGPALLEASATGAEPPQHGNRSRTDAPHGIFRCAGEDAWCAVAVEGDATWQALVRAIGRADLAADPALATASGRLAAQDHLEAALGAWCAARPRKEAAATLRAAGVPAAAVASARDLVEGDPQLAARRAFQHVDHPEVGPILLNAPPFAIDGERVELLRQPLFGEHTEAVLTGLLGLSRDRVAELAAQGVLA